MVGINLIIEEGVQQKGIFELHVILPLVLIKSIEINLILSK